MTLESLDARNPSEREFGTEQTCNRVGISDVLLVQGTRMEERLDDAINVLRNHAESQLGLHLGPVGPHGSIYSHTSPPQLDHLVRIFVCRATAGRQTMLIFIFLSLFSVQTSPHPAVTVTQPQGSYSGLTPTPDTDGSIKIERLPVTNASKCSNRQFRSSDCQTDCERLVERGRKIREGEEARKRQERRRALTIGDRWCCWPRSILGVASSDKYFFPWAAESGRKKSEEKEFPGVPRSS